MYATHLSPLNVITNVSMLYLDQVWKPLLKESLEPLKVRQPHL